MSYDQQTRTFSIYSEDASLVGTQDYTLSAFLTDQPSVVTDVMTAQIEISGPCSQVVITLDGSLQNKSYTITDFEFIYKIPDILVDPASCLPTISHEVSPIQGLSAV